MNTKKNNQGAIRWPKKIFIILVWVILISFFTILIGFFTFNSYLQSHEKKIIENISFFHNGKLTFEKAYVSWLKDFPNISVVVEQVQLSNKRFQDELNPVIKDAKVSIHLNAENWRLNSLKIKELVIEGGEFIFYKDKEGVTNFSQLFEQKGKKIKEEANDQGISINTDDFNISLHRLQVNVIDSVKMMFLDGMVNHLETRVRNSPSKKTLETNMNISVGGLTFDAHSGTFLRNALVVGEFSGEIADGHINVDEFPIHINDQTFQLEAKIATNRKLKTSLYLTNPRTILEDNLPLLSDRIIEKMQPFKVYDEFHSVTKIEMLPGTIPFIEVSFDIPSNNLQVGEFPFYGASLSGKFVTRYPASLQDQSVSKGDFHLDLEDIKSGFENFEIQSKNILIYGKKHVKPTIVSEATLIGKAEDISEYYKSDKFLLEKGNFRLETSLNGKLDNLSNLFLESSANLHLGDLNFYYKQADVSIPIDSLNLYKKAGDATFNLASTTLVNDYNYRLNGGLENLASLLYDNLSESTESFSYIYANRLAWEDFFELFANGKNGTKKKKAKDTKKSMKTTFKGLYNKFRPRLILAIDTFSYLDKIQLYNFKSGAYFENENLLVLDSTNFSLDQGTVSLNAVIDISNPNSTVFKIDLLASDVDLSTIMPALDYFGITILSNHPTYSSNFYLDIQLEGILDDADGFIYNKTKGKISFRDKNANKIYGNISFTPSENEMYTTAYVNGNPNLFNTFFNTENFIFQDAGFFETSLNYRGDVTSITELFNQAKIDFRIKNGEVYYNTVDIIFPIKDLGLFLTRDTVVYDLTLNSEALNRSMALDGAVNNFSELVFGNTGKRLSTKVNLSSPFIKLDDAIFIFQTPPKPDKVKTTTDIKIKELTSSLLKHFNPQVHVSLDSFIINEDIRLANVKTGVQLIDTTFVKLDQTEFNFSEGEIGLNMDWDISKGKIDPFEGNLSSTKLSLKEFLEKLDYFDIEELKNAKNIDGEINISLDFEGKLEDLKLLEDTTKAELNFQIDSLQLEGIELVDKITKKLRISKYFQKIRFAAIASSVSLDGTHIDIPIMEVQSNVGSFFVEGYIDKNKETNLWISFPLSDLYHFRTNTIPEKQGYALSNAKVYLELSQDADNPLKTKFHLNKKKFYRQRNMFDQYRIDKNKYRIIKKQAKKAK